MQQYIYKAYLKNTNKKLVNLLKESVGIRGISRLLQISKTTVLKSIVEISQKHTLIALCLIEQNGNRLK